MDLTKMERVGDRWQKMEGYFSTGQSPQWAVVPMEEEYIYNSPLISHLTVLQTLLYYSPHILNFIPYAF
jgi:hypothetical protein